MNDNTPITVWTHSNRVIYPLRDQPPRDQTFQDLEAISSYYACETALGLNELYLIIGNVNR